MAEDQDEVCQEAETAMSKKEEQPNRVCKSCGDKHGRYVLDKAAVFRRGICKVCGKETDVTSPWNYAGMRSGWRKHE